MDDARGLSPEVSIQQADCEKDLAAAIPLVEQAEAWSAWSY